MQLDMTMHSSLNMFLMINNQLLQKQDFVA